VHSTNIMKIGSQFYWSA